MERKQQVKKIVEDLQDAVPRRSGKMQSAMDDLSMSMFGHRQYDETKTGKPICVFCGTAIDVDNFKDELSRKEFRISGICQRCQDETFG